MNSTKITVPTLDKIGNPYPLDFLLSYISDIKRAEPIQTHALNSVWFPLFHCMIISKKDIVVFFSQ
jgi:hypothetical protein